MLLHLEGLPGPVRLCPRSQPVADALRAVLAGWPARIDGGDTGSDAFLEIERGDGAFRMHRVHDGWRSIESDDLGIVCSAIVEIVNGYVDDTPGLGLLHAGSVAFGDRLVLFPASRRAGKSTLVTRLLAGGRKVFSDDLIPIELASGMAVATGCLPRPRLPLPANATAAFRRFVDRHALARDDDYAYVEPGSDRRVMFGDRMPLGAVVLLQRAAAPVKAALEPAPADEVLWTLLAQDTRRNSPARAMLDDYLRIVGGVQRWRLSYFDLEDAVRCLDDAFASWDEAPLPVRTESRAGTAGVAASAHPGEVGGAQFRCGGHLEISRVGDAGFLVDRRNNTIHNVNAAGMAVWDLLGEGATRDAIVAVFCEAFPGMPRETLVRDVDATLAMFGALGLLVATDGSGEANLS